MCLWYIVVYSHSDGVIGITHLMDNVQSIWCFIVKAFNNGILPIPCGNVLAQYSVIHFILHLLFNNNYLL